MTASIGRPVVRAHVFCGNDVYTDSSASSATRDRTSGELLREEGARGRQVRGPAGGGSIQGGAVHPAGTGPASEVGGEAQVFSACAEAPLRAPAAAG